MRFIPLSAIAISVESLNNKLLKPTNKQTKTLVIYNTLQEVRGCTDFYLQSQAYPYSDRGLD